MSLLDALTLYNRIKKERDHINGLAVSAYLKILDVLRFSIKAKRFSLSVYITRDA